MATNIVGQSRERSRRLRQAARGHLQLSQQVPGKRKGRWIVIVGTKR